MLLHSLCTLEACEEFTCNVFGKRIYSDEYAHVSIGAVRLTPESFVFWCISISGFLQAIIFSGVGPIADFGNFRKNLLILSAIGGSSLVCCYFLCWDPSTWWLAGIICIISSVVYGLGAIAINAYLPVLVDSHEMMVAHVPEDEESSSDLAITLMNQISQIGGAWGNVGSICIVFATMILLITYSEFNYVITPPDAETMAFSELYGRKVVGIQVNFSDDAVYAMEFEYCSCYDAHARSYGVRSDESLLGHLNSSEGIGSVDVWRSDLRITGIRFNDHDRKSEDVVYGQKKSEESAITHGSGDWDLAGWKANAKEGENTDGGITSIAFLWKDPTTDIPINTFAYRMALLITGLWWMIFGSITLYELKPRPGPNFPANEKWYYGFKRTANSFWNAHENPSIMWYLQAWYVNNNI